MAQVHNLKSEAATPDTWVLDFYLDAFPAAVMGHLCPCISSTLCICLSHQDHSGHFAEGVKVCEKSSE